LLLAQPTPLERARIPFGTAGDAARMRSTMGLAKLRVFVDHFRADREKLSAGDHFLLAELLMQLGDYSAAEDFESAIAADPDEPAYALFYADYLRNFRGPRRPLFAEAERQYFAARRALAKRAMLLAGTEGGPAYLEIVLDRIDRGLVALYQEDGLPLYWRDSGEPTLFLSSVNRMARSTADLDEVHDTRDFTAEALLAASADRLGKPLTEDELRAIVRIKEPTATVERLRFRRGASPVFDVFYHLRNIGSAQITDFHKPRVFNDVELRAFGAAVEKTFDLSRSDLYLRAALSSLQRTGVVETNPRAEETIEQVDVQAAVSRFVGPDKVILDFAYTLQSINPDIPSPPERDRRIAGVTAEYQVLRPLSFLRDPYGQLFETRGIRLYGGFADDSEGFGGVTVTRRDYFAGASVKGLGRFDVTLQPGYIDSHVSGDRSQTSAQFRTDLTVLIRLLDEERKPGIPTRRFAGLHPAFVHLVLPFKHDTSRTGLEALENYKIGAALNAKFFRRSFAPDAFHEGAPRARPATILFSLRYDRQWFPQLDETLHLFGVGISLGY
jgi:hypothetical protein